VWRWYLASRAVCVLLLVPESGVLSDITYITRVLSESGPASALPEYPWPAVALLDLPRLLGAQDGLQFHLSLVALFIAIDAAFAWFLWRASDYRMSRGMIVWLLVGPALGPLVLAQCHAWTGSYAAVFYTLAGIVGLLGLGAWRVRAPHADGRTGGGYRVGE